MPDPTLSEAIREAYATAPSDVVILHTLEISHPSFSAPIRVVRDYVDLSARLEAGAPANGGEIVTFTAYAFDIQPPELTAGGAPQCSIAIDNISPEIARQIDAAVHAGDPITIRYRAFLSTDPTAGPENDPPLTLTIQSVTATPFRVEATASFRNFSNRRFPRAEYDPEVFTGLAS